MKRILSFLLISFLFLLFIPSAYAEIKINEIYPSPNSGEEEWVEFYNNGNESADLNNWQLDDIENGGGSPKFLSLTIAPMSYAIYSLSSGMFNNSGDSVILKNQNNEKVDEFNYNTINNGTSYGRCPDGSNNLQNLTGVTKNQSNNNSCPPTPTVNPPTATDQPTVTTEPTVSSSPTNISAPTNQTIINNIYLSEVMIAPSSGNKEWVEIYNDNSFSVNVTNWFIDDIEAAGMNPKQFSMIIDTKGYKIFELSSSIFNNDEDVIRLLDDQQRQKDIITYQNGQSNLTIGRSDWVSKNICWQSPSPNQSNNSCIINSPIPTQTSTTVSPAATTSPSSAPTPTLSPTPNSRKIVYLNYSSANPPPIQPKILGIQDDKFTNPENIDKYYSSVILALCLSFFFSSQTVVYILYKLIKSKY